MEDMFSNLQQFITNFIQQVQGLSPWLAAGCVVIVALMYAFGGQQASQMAKSWGWKIVVGLFVIWGVAAIINTLISMFGADGSVSEIDISSLEVIKDTVETLGVGQTVAMAFTGLL